MADGLRRAGFKLTPQRLAVVREIAEDATHPTAQELFERLRPELPSMSFATLYNTLDALANAGLCVKIAVSRPSARFDPNTSPHHHTVCDACGAVRDVPAEERRGPNEHVARVPSVVRDAPAGFRVRSVERVYRGLCAECAEEAAHASG